MPTRDELHAAIAREQALIPRLERQREEAQSRVRSLHTVLDGPAEGAERTSRRTSPPLQLRRRSPRSAACFAGARDSQLTRSNAHW
jgi:hypothetical protein